MCKPSHNLQVRGLWTARILVFPRGFNPLQSVAARELWQSLNFEVY